MAKVAAITRTLVVGIACLVLPSVLWAQWALIGTVRCLRDGNEAQPIGIQYATVSVITFDVPRRAGVTTNIGHFRIQFREGEMTPAARFWLSDQTVSVEINGSRSITQPVSISRAAFRRLGNDSVVVVPSIESKMPCHLIREEADIVVARHQRIELAPEIVPSAIRGVSGRNGFAFALIGFGVASSPVGDQVLPVLIDTVRGPSPALGFKGMRPLSFTPYAYSMASSAVGFTFTPTRHLGEALFWSPAGVEREHTAGVSLQFDAAGFGRSVVLLPVGPVSVMAGLQTLVQTETRALQLPNGVIDKPLTVRETEYAAALTVRPSWRLGVGGTLKYRVQRTDNVEGIVVPARLSLTQSITQITPAALVERVKGGTVDADLSVNFFASPRINLGAALLNVTGQRATLPNGKTGTLRAFGAGGTFEFARLYVGADILLADGVPRRPSVGLDYRYRSRSSVRLGYSGAYSTLNAGVDVAWVRYTYHHSERWGSSHTFGIVRGLR